MARFEGIRSLVRRSPQDEPLVIQLGRIIEAIDVLTGRNVMLDRWIEYVEARAGLSGSTHVLQARHWPITRAAILVQRSEGNL